MTLTDTFPRDIARNEAEKLALLMDIKLALSLPADQRLYLLQTLPEFAAQRATSVDKPYPVQNRADRPLQGQR